MWNIEKEANGGAPNEHIERKKKRNDDAKYCNGIQN